MVTERRADCATLALRYQEETLEQENRRLRREVAVLRQEQAFATKWRRMQLVVATPLACDELRPCSSALPEFSSQSFCAALR